MAEQPFEVIAQPGTLYLAAVGADFPEPNATPGGSWTKVGSDGDLNYQEKGGVTITHKQKVEAWRAAGSTGPRKAFRTEEETRLQVVVNDLTLEQYALAMGYNTVTTTPPSTGVAGTKKVGLSRGLQVPQRALLFQLDASPYGDGWKSQYEFPVVVQVGEPKVVYQKGEPAGLELEFLALEDPNASSDDERFGRLVVQNTDEGT